MGPEHLWWGGWWLFPIIMPMVMLLGMLLVFYVVVGRGGWRPSWWEERGRDFPRRRDSETALEILKKRYAQGELTREEFEQMKKDIMS